MRNEKGEITFKSFFKWLRSDSGKRYSFFIFYGLFFIFVFVILSFSNNDNTLNNNVNNNNNSNDNSVNNNQETNKEESVFPYSIKNIEDTSYDFSYVVNFNDESKEYLGYKNNDKITIQEGTNTYEYNYQDGNLVYQGTMEPIDNIEFLNIYELKRIIKNSKLVSETRITDTREYLYNYVIKSNSLNDLLNSDIEIIDNLENEIIIQADSLNNFKKITMNITNYFKEISEDSESIDNYKITFTYGDNNE